MYVHDTYSKKKCVFFSARAKLIVEWKHFEALMRASCHEAMSQNRILMTVSLLNGLKE